MQQFQDPGCAFLRDFKTVTQKFGGLFQYLGHGEKGKRVGSGLHKLNLSTPQRPRQRQKIASLLGLPADNKLHLLSLQGQRTAFASPEQQRMPDKRFDCAGQSEEIPCSAPVAFRLCCGQNSSVLLRKPIHPY